MSAEHTPGPSRLLSDEIKAHRDRSPGDPIAMLGIPSMTLLGWIEQTRKLEQDAAAAPELLDALRAMDSAFGEACAFRERNGYGSIFDGSLDNAAGQIRAILAKLEGGAR